LRQFVTEVNGRGIHFMHARFWHEDGLAFINHARLAELCHRNTVSYQEITTTFKGHSVGNLTRQGLRQTSLSNQLTARRESELVVSKSSRRLQLSALKKGSS
jgi:hypothetical protein